MLPMDTDLLVQLPDGTWAVVHQAMSWGDIVILLVLVALLMLYIYDLWNRTRI